MYPRDIVCLRNISEDTLHKGDTEDDDDNDDDDDDDNNNNSNNNTNEVRMRPLAMLSPKLCLVQFKSKSGPEQALINVSPFTSSAPPHSTKNFTHS